MQYHKLIHLQPLNLSSSSINNSIISNTNNNNNNNNLVINKQQEISTSTTTLANDSTTISETITTKKFLNIDEKTNNIEINIDFYKFPKMQSPKRFNLN